MSGTLNRRQLLRNVALGAAVGSLPAGAAMAEAVSDSSAGGPLLAGPLLAGPDAGPWWLLAPYAPGVEVGLGWRVGALTTPDRGALLLQLHHSGGDSARVNICYHQGAPKGIGYTDQLDLVLMDGGDGARPTEESVGRVIRQLALVMRQNEAAALAEDGPAAAQLAELLTHSERVERFGAGSLL